MPGKCQSCVDLKEEIAACPCGVDDAPPTPFVVEKGIPIPEKRTTYRELLGLLQVGDSMFLGITYLTPLLS